MGDPNIIKIDEAAENLLNNHLFNPTAKTQWISELLLSGLSEAEAKRAYKIAAVKYHALRNMQNSEKDKMTVAKVAKYTVVGVLTFMIGPWVYLVFVMILIAILAFIFRF